MGLAIEQHHRVEILVDRPTLVHRLDYHHQRLAGGPIEGELAILRAALPENSRGGVIVVNGIRQWAATLREISLYDAERPVGKAVLVYAFPFQSGPLQDAGVGKKT